MSHSPETGPISRLCVITIRKRKESVREFVWENNLPDNLPDEASPGETGSAS